MQLSFILSPQFQKSEYLQVLQEIEKEFSSKLPDIRKVVIEIKLHSKAIYKPAFVISGMVSEQLYKVKMNFTRIYKENNLPDPALFCEKIKTAVNRLVTLSGRQGNTHTTQE
ncbi:MAG: hypothetical protein QM764_16915 [Chitinophagaceae bacterium]